MYETQERAKRITDIHVLWGQSTVIEELIQAGKIDEEYIYPFNGDEVLEWRLVTPWLAERLKEHDSYSHLMGPSCGQMGTSGVILRL